MLLIHPLLGVNTAVVASSLALKTCMRSFDVHCLKRILCCRIALTPSSRVSRCSRTCSHDFLLGVSYFCLGWNLDLSLQFRQVTPESSMTVHKLAIHHLFSTQNAHISLASELGGFCPSFLFTFRCAYVACTADLSVTHRFRHDSATVSRMGCNRIQVRFAIWQIQTRFASE